VSFRTPIVFRERNVVSQVEQKMNNKPITKKQEKVLYFIEGYVRSHRISPTLSEIQDAFGWKSKTSAADHVGRLIEKGFLRRVDSSARSLQVLR
jgi:repressor LexA